MKLIGALWIQIMNMDHTFINVKMLTWWMKVKQGAEYIVDPVKFQGYFANNSIMFTSNQRRAVMNLEHKAIGQL